MLLAPLLRFLIPISCSKANSFGSILANGRKKSCALVVGVISADVLEPIPLFRELVELLLIDIRQQSVARYPSGTLRLRPDGGVVGGVAGSPSPDTNKSVSLLRKCVELLLILR